MYVYSNFIYNSYIYNKNNIAFEKDNPISNVNLYTGIVISAVLSLLILFVTNFMTSSFFFRDGLFLVAFSIAFICIAEHKLDVINTYFAAQQEEK